MNIRDATAADASIIARFNSAMAVETGEVPLDPDIIGAGVTQIIKDKTKGLYWLAEIDGEVVGQISVTYEWSDWRDGMQWWIQSVYILPEHRRMGVFTALYRHVESTARADDGICGLRLYVKADNERAQNTYKSLGMSNTGYIVMGEQF